MDRPFSRTGVLWTVIHRGRLCFASFGAPVAVLRPHAGTWSECCYARLLIWRCQDLVADCVALTWRAVRHLVTPPIWRQTPDLPFTELAFVVFSEDVQTQQELSLDLLTSQVRWMAIWLGRIPIVLGLAWKSFATRSNALYNYEVFNEGRLR